MSNTNFYLSIKNNIEESRKAGDLFFNFSIKEPLVGEIEALFTFLNSDEINARYININHGYDNITYILVGI